MKTSSLVVLLSACVLSACQMNTAGGTASRAAVSLAGGLHMVSAPSGFCVDRASLQNGPATSFVMFEKCRGLFSASKAPDAVLTFSANSNMAFEQDFDEEAFEAYFTSKAGKAALARDGRAASVAILELSHSPDQVRLHARDRSSGAFDGLADDYWRLITVQNARLVSFSAISTENSGLDDSSLNALLDQFVAMQQDQ